MMQFANVEVTFGRGVNPLRQRVFKPRQLAGRDERRKIMLEIPVFLLARFEICVRNVIDCKYRQLRILENLSGLRGVPCPVIFRARISSSSDIPFSPGGSYFRTEWGDRGKIHSTSHFAACRRRHSAPASSSCTHQVARSLCSSP
jgi:hypothetical protein